MWQAKNARSNEWPASRTARIKQTASSFSDLDLIEEARGVNLFDDITGLDVYDEIMGLGMPGSDFHLPFRI